MSTDIVMGEAFDLAVKDLNTLIDRQFAATRLLVVEREGQNWTCAIGDNVLWRNPDPQLCAGWIRRFLQEHPEVRVRGMADLLVGHSESVRVPDNVVPILGREAVQ